MSVHPATVAATETAVAKRKVKQAGELCRKAAQRLAEAQDVTTYGTQRVETDDDLQRADSLIRAAIAEHHHVDVVVVASPRP